MKTVLFLCTGNYYRSRFAEQVFDDRAARLSVPWRATSRALSLERGSGNVGPISRFAADALRRMGLEPSSRLPQQATTADLQRADLVVALKDAEHRPLLAERFSAWSAEHLADVVFWDVDDIDVLDPASALSRIEANVGALCETLRIAPHDRT
ncbi:Protein-tyrosine-phosphatase (fragment) [Beijerinckiaceae bacterium RH AL1]